MREKAWKEGDGSFWGGTRVQDRRREKGSGIGKSRGEGGTNKESETESEGNREGNRERETEGDAERWKKWEGETDLRERNGEESEAFWIFSLQDFVSVAQWSFSSSGKNFLPLSNSSSPFILLWLSFSVFLCSFLSASAPPSTFLVSALSVHLFISLSPCLNSFVLAPVSLSRTFCPCLRPSFDGLLSLLSSSRLHRPLFSQDASLQGVLHHQNGTETGGERESSFSGSNLDRVLEGCCFL